MIHDKVEIREPVRSARLKIASAEVLFLFLFPAVAYLLFRPSPINQAGSIDPYVYTGYIHNIEDLLARYHLPYYSVRFGLILPARLFGLAFGFENGYLILRYLLALVAGIPLYLVAKRNFGMPLALATYATLLTSPFLAKSLLWEHPDATAVPYLLASTGLFLLELRPRWAWDTGAGFLFGLAVHSNFFTVSIFGLFLLALALAYVIHGNRLLPLVQRLVWICAGFVIATAVGVSYYYYLAGVWNIFSPTAGIVVWLARGGMLQWRIPGAAWIAFNLQVLVLPLVALCSGLMFLLRRRTVVSSVLSIYVVAIAIYYYVYHFALKADVLQLPYYFAYCLPAILLALPVMFDALWNISGQSHRRWLAVLMAAGFIGPWLSIMYAFDWRSSVHLVQFGILATALLGLFVLCVRARISRNLRLAMVSITTLLFGIVFDFGFGGATYGQMFQSKTRQTEQDVYRVAEQFMAAVPKMKDRPGGVRFWYNNRPGNLVNSVQSTYLWGYSRCNQAVPDDPGMPFIGPFEFGAFSDKTVKYIVLIGETEDENDKGMAALQKREIPYTRVDHRLLASGNYRVYFETLQLTGH